MEGDDFMTLTANEKHSYQQGIGSTKMHMYDVVLTGFVRYFPQRLEWLMASEPHKIHSLYTLVIAK